MKRLAAIAIALALSPALAPAVDAVDPEAAVVLKEAPGKAIVEQNCVMCHSLDYIQMNSVFLDRKGWEGSVGKMIKVMGAPITPEDAKAALDYLEAAYGKPAEPPRK